MKVELWQIIGWVNSRFEWPILQSQRHFLKLHQAIQCVGGHTLFSVIPSGGDSLF
jgi:hypothetical protein